MLANDPKLPIPLKLFSCSL